MKHDPNGQPRATTSSRSAAFYDELWRRLAEIRVLHQSCPAQRRDQGLHRLALLDENRARHIDESVEVIEQLRGLQRLRGVVQDRRQADRLGVSPTASAWLRRSWSPTVNSIGSSRTE